MFFDKKVKKMDAWDVALTKWSVVAFVFLLMTIWSGLNTWVHSVNPWYFFAVFVILYARPVYRGYIKK